MSCLYILGVPEMTVIVMSIVNYVILGKFLNLSEAKLLLLGIISILM